MITSHTNSRHLPLLTQMYPGTALLDVEQIAKCINWNPGSIYNLVNTPKVPFKIQKVSGKLCASIIEVADYLDGFLTASAASQTSDADSQPKPRKGPGRPRGSTKERARVQIFQAQLRTAICVDECNGALLEIIGLVTNAKIGEINDECESEFFLAKSILTAEIGTIHAKTQRIFEELQSSVVDDEEEQDEPDED